MSPLLYAILTSLSFSDDIHYSPLLSGSAVHCSLQESITDTLAGHLLRRLETVRSSIVPLFATLAFPSHTPAPLVSGSAVHFSLQGDIDIQVSHPSFPGLSPSIPYPTLLPPLVSGSADHRSLQGNIMEGIVLRVVPLSSVSQLKRMRDEHQGAGDCDAS